MQIIIAQAEIEKAIHDFVLRQVSIRPDQRVDIELKATRGESGYQAIINISNPEDVVQLAAAVSQQAPLATPTVGRPPRTPAAVRAMLAAETAQEEAAADVTETPVEENNTVEEPKTDPGEESPKPVAMAQVRETSEQVGGAPNNPPRKLFGGFARPTNS